jgi:hypothetical protein
MDLFLHPKNHITGSLADIDFSLADVAPCHRFTAVGNHPTDTGGNGCLMTVSFLDSDGTVVDSSANQLLQGTVELDMAVSARVKTVRVGMDPNGGANSDHCSLQTPVVRCELRTSSPFALNSNSNYSNASSTNATALVRPRASCT